MSVDPMKIVRRANAVGEGFEPERDLNRRKRPTRNFPNDGRRAAFMGQGRRMISMALIAEFPD